MNRAIIERFVHPMLRMGRFMNRMGLVSGAATYARVVQKETEPQSSQTYSVRVRGYDREILLRPGDSDGLIFTQVIVDQQYNLPELPDTSVIVDCGANIGLSSLFFARKYPKATILAIEPEPQTYALMVRNTQHLPNIRPIHGAVWPRPASLSIIDPTRSWASMRVSESGGAGTSGIEAVVLRDVVAEFGKIDILKVDIEGSEKALFEDPACDEWLAHTRVIYCELHDWLQKGCSRAFYQAITRYEFSQLQSGEIVAIDLHNTAPVGQ